MSFDMFYINDELFLYSVDIFYINRVLIYVIVDLFLFNGNVNYIKGVFFVQKIVDFYHYFEKTSLKPYNHSSINYTFVV